MSNNADIIRNVYDAFGKGDIPTVLGSMDPNVGWREAEGVPYPGTYVGPDPVLPGVFLRPPGGVWARRGETRCRTGRRSSRPTWRPGTSRIRRSGAGCWRKPGPTMGRT